VDDTVPVAANSSCGTPSLWTDQSCSWSHNIYLCDYMQFSLCVPRA